MCSEVWAEGKHLNLNPQRGFSREPDGALARLRESALLLSQIAAGMECEWRGVPEGSIRESLMAHWRVFVNLLCS